MEHMISVLPDPEVLAEYRILLDLVLIIIAIKGFGHLSVRLGQPAVLGELLAGIVLGPSVLGIVRINEFITGLAEIGVILLMFLAGLETDIRKFVRNAYASTLTAIGGVILPFVGGTMVALIFGYSVNAAIFIGTVLVATSVSISVQTLRELGALQTTTGMVILGAAVFDDVLGIVVLSLIIGLTVGGSVTGEAALFVIALIKIVLFFALAIAFGLVIIPRLLRFAHRLRVSEPVIACGLALVFLYAYAAEAFGLAAIVGAYMAGLMMSITDFQGELFAKIDCIGYSFFVPIFLVSIGLRADASQASWIFLGFTLALTAIAVVSKIIGCGLGSLAAGFSGLTSLGIGAGMVARGEVALMLGTIGRQRGLIDGQVFTAIVLLVVATTLVTPPLVKMAVEMKRRRRQRRAASRGQQA